MTMKRVFAIIVGLLAVVGLGALAAGLTLLAGGIAAKPEPGPLETRAARSLRRLAIPAGARGLKNPVALTDDARRSGLAHFADHCAMCHANDGSGQTDMGRNMYPRAPDMRRADTQKLSDGELFYIIENGIRLTGMPAWGTGTAEGERGSWQLVHFIRHLPKLTAEEIEQMKALNPRSPEAFRADEEMRRFLAGEGERPAPSPSPMKHGGH